MGHSKIQIYIFSLIFSLLIQRFGEDFENLLKVHDDLLVRERQIKDILNKSEKEMNSANTFKPINSSSLDDVTISDAEVCESLFVF